MLVIVNVDDLGLHPAVRRAVEELWEMGVVSSATLMVNGPDAENAARIQGPGIGVHLNILRGRPVSPAHEIKTLVGTGGMFLGDYGALLKRHATGGIDLRQVELEFSRQIERARELGATPTHVDSEKHIHAWPAMMQAAARAAKSHGISAMRRPLECVDLLRPGKGLARTGFLRMCSLFQKQSEGMRMPGLIWGIAAQGEALAPEKFLDYIRSNPGRGAVEICCHPGRPLPQDGPLSSDYGNMRVSGQWQAEYDALSQRDWKGAFSQAGMRLASFADLPEQA